MNDIHLFKYNNYFNRIVKKEDVLQGYYYNSNAAYTKQNLNFKLSDGINTSQIINYTNSQDEFKPDYAVITEDSSEEILSRWFITHSEKISGTQYRLSLKRDTIADYYDDVLTAPSFIEKATLDPSDPAIYNSENMSFNQIKKSETLIKDSSDSPWIVGYVSRDYNTALNVKVSSSIDYYLDDMNFYPYYRYLDDKVSNVFNDNSIFLTFYSYGPEGSYSYYKWEVGYSNVKLTKVKDPGFSVYIWQFQTGYSEANIRNIMESNLRKIERPDFNYNLSGLYQVVEPILDNIIKENNKLIFNTTTSTYTRLEVSRTPLSDLMVEDKTNVSELYLKKLMGDYISSNVIVGDVYMAPADIVYDFDGVVLSSDDNPLVNADEVNIPFNLPRTICEDSPYDLFCIPYEDFTINDKFFPKDQLLQLATGLASVSGVVYDVQLLPYCPLINIPLDKSLNVTVPSQDAYEISDERDNIIGYMLWCSRSKFSFKINNDVIIDNIKMANETDLWRLNSPNYQGSFDINLAKNTDDYRYGMRYFDIDCHYKPIQPYIHIAPNFGGLYGKDFNDARGLICGGDFSIPSVTDRWLQYEINNKNYLSSFDRNIESMELKHKWGTISDISGIVTGSVSGGLMGGFLGGPVGTGLGSTFGVIDGVTNAIANHQFRKDEMDLTKDQFGFQLGNIQALPNTLNKVGSFNNNNKIFPFMEYYTCTDIEKEALESKLKYNGMTVGRISTVGEFIRNDKTFIKGKIIRMNDIENVDYDDIQDISYELNRGIFI